MALEFKDGFGPRNVMKENFLLSENPFRISAIYNPDSAGPYEPKMYGAQYEEFCEKFFLRPLMRGKNKQVIGAIWSSQSPSDWRGFGKSMLLGESRGTRKADLYKTLQHDFSPSKNSAVIGPRAEARARDTREWRGLPLELQVAALEEILAGIDVRLDR